VSKIIHGQDDRLLCVVGPCSIHDAKAAKEYAVLLAALSAELKDDICMVMRVYFEKPRTTIGWKGLINDPDMDGTYAINKGLRLGRSLMLEINQLGLPIGCELLDTISPQFVSDLMSWGAIGARTTESQLHRELVSGMSIPCGFKNGSDGGVQVAIDACISGSSPHSFLGVTDQGLAAIVKTKGNADCHIILRGGNDGPNYTPVHVNNTLKAVKATKGTDGKVGGVIIDCSHGNSGKDYRNQGLVAESVAAQLARGSTAIVGVMLESNLVAGAQKLVLGKADELTYGKSVTDECVAWDETVDTLRTLAKAVQRRRAHLKPQPKL
jgi:3-deoxy-7-phosphoheptulonate synthase